MMKAIILITLFFLPLVEAQLEESSKQKLLEIFQTYYNKEGLQMNKYISDDLLNGAIPVNLLKVAYQQMYENRPKDNRDLPILTKSDKQIFEEVYKTTSGEAKAYSAMIISSYSPIKEYVQLYLELLESKNADEYSYVVHSLGTRFNPRSELNTQKEKQYLAKVFQDKFNNEELNEQLSDFQKKKLEELQTIYFLQYATDNQTKDSKINPNLLTNNTPQTDQPKQTEQKPKAQEEVETIKAAATTTSEKQTPTWLIYALAALGLIVLLLVIKKLKNKE